MIFKTQVIQFEDEGFTYFVCHRSDGSIACFAQKPNGDLFPTTKVPASLWLDLIDKLENPND